MEPVRKCNRAQYFAEERIDGVTKWAPCEPTIPGARRMGLMDVPANSLRLPDLTAVRGM